MGLKHSSAVTDAALCSLAETRFALRDDIKRMYGIRGSWRFRDDILVIQNNSVATNPDRALQNWFAEHKRRAGPTFSMSVVELSAKEVTMLSNVIYRGRHRWLAQVKPRTNECPPLNMTSAHPRTVTSRWPYAQLRALEALGSTDNDLKQAREILATV